MSTERVLVTGMGGELVGEAREGGGACVRFGLPLARDGDLI